MTTTEPTLSADASRLAEVDHLTATFNESTALSWLWAFIFGPLYFAAHGFWGRAALVLLLNFLIIGFLIAPFLAYPAWRARAEKRAHQTLQTAALLRR